MKPEVIKEIMKQMVKAHDEYSKRMGWLYLEFQKEMKKK